MDQLMKRGLNLFPRTWLIYLSQKLLPFIGFFFKGKGFYDPINKKNYRRFLPYGYAKVRKNVLSPGTLSLERHRLLWCYLKRETSFFFDRLNVLHVAPEQCFYPRFKACTNLNYTTTDLHSPLADVKADLCALPFLDASFDVVICNHVLEHILDDRRAIKEIHRILKPRGWAILQVPLDYSRRITYEDDAIVSPEERIRHFGQYDHVRVYGLDYYHRLEEQGFRVEKWKVSDVFNEQEIKEMALDEQEILPIVSKL